MARVIFSKEVSNTSAIGNGLYWSLRGDANGISYLDSQQYGPFNAVLVRNKSKFAFDFYPDGVTGNGIRVEGKTTMILNPGEMPEYGDLLILDQSGSGNSIGAAEIYIRVIKAV